MRTHRLSLSKRLPCLYWARPDVKCPEDVLGPKGQIGKIVHGLVEHKLTGREFDVSVFDKEVLSDALDIFKGPINRYVEEWALKTGEHHVERRLRYDADDDRVFDVPKRDSKDYLPPGAMQVTGEMDLVRVLDDFIEVEDIKTGKKENTLESQLRAYAVLAAREWNKSHVRARFVYARKTKLDFSNWIEMNLDDIDAEAGAIRRELRTLPMAETVKGNWCWTCPMGPRRGVSRPSPCPEWMTDDRYQDEGESRLYSDDVRLDF